MTFSLRCTHIYIYTSCAIAIPFFKEGEGVVGGCTKMIADKFRRHKSKIFHTGPNFRMHVTKVCHNALQMPTRRPFFPRRNKWSSYNFSPLQFSLQVLSNLFFLLKILMEFCFFSSWTFSPRAPWPHTFTTMVLNVDHWIGASTFPASTATKKHLRTFKIKFAKGNKSKSRTHRMIHPSLSKLSSLPSEQSPVKSSLGEGRVKRSPVSLPFSLCFIYIYVASSKRSSVVAICVLDSVELQHSGVRTKAPSLFSSFRALSHSHPVRVSRWNRATCATNQRLLNRNT